MGAFWLVFFLVMVVAFIIALTRTGKVASDTMGSRIRGIVTPADPQAAFDALRALHDPKLKVDDADPGSKRLVLSSPVTVFSWGFLYPIEIHQNGSGSRILIGCKSKFFQLGPVVSHAHERCVAAVEGALSVPRARIA